MNDKALIKKLLTLVDEYGVLAMTTYEDENQDSYAFAFGTILEACAATGTDPNKLDSFQDIVKDYKMVLNNNSKQE